MAEPGAVRDVGGLDSEDQKLVTLARAARARTRAPEGAALRDDLGRTYAASTVRLPSLQLSALQAAVAAAFSSGSDIVTAVVVHTAAGELGRDDRAVVADVDPDIVLLADADGSVRRLR